jgi:hypothetical protein
MKTTSPPCQSQHVMLGYIPFNTGAIDGRS